MTSPTPRYDHTQHGKLHYGLWALGVGLLVGGLASVPGDTQAILTTIGALLVVITPMFASLRVRDTGDGLRLTYGPIPLFRKTIPYDRIVAFQPRETPLIHGLGIHGWPGKWWTWNLWGRECVSLTLRKDGDETTLNVGTDDREGLTSHLSQTIDARLQAHDGDGDERDAA